MSKLLSVNKLFYSLTIALFASLMPSVDSSALQIDLDCKTIEVVYARGSGQALIEENNESLRFKNQLASRIKSPLSMNYYELGTESYGSNKYQAVDVENWRNGNLIGAAVSSGEAFDYGDSVDSGVAELKSYLTQRQAKCPDAQFILGGYSQGAQVIGEALPKLTASVQNSITFSALFGDPKLYLPEGEGIYPDACRGKNLSSWRRVIGNCHTDNGVFGARKPYLPDAVSTKTGLWCNAVDMVCGSSKLWTSLNGHGKYKDEGAAIDQAAIEIAQKIKARASAEQADSIDDSYLSLGVGTTGIDVAFVLDTTGSMSAQINQSKQFIRDYAQRIENMRGRVSLTVYRDKDDTYSAKILSNLQTDTEDLLAKIDGVSADGGGDWPEATLHALTTTFNGLNWKDGATKAAIVITDSPFHNPDKIDGSTVDSVAKRSLEIDPVNVYPVVASPVASAYSQLAEKTNGQVVVDFGNTADALDTVLTKLEDRPTALLKNTAYYALPGQEITFDASDSYVIDSTINSYEWDFDGDGVYEKTTTTPSVDHVYGAEFDGNMQVRLRAANGTVASASAVVKIGAVNQVAMPAAPSKLEVEVTSTVDNKSSIRLSWQPTDSLADTWAVAVNGMRLGYVSGEQTSLEITDVERAAAVEFSVVGANADRELGESSSITLDAIVDEPTEPQPGLSLWQLIQEWLRRIYSWFTWY